MRFIFFLFFLQQAFANFSFFIPPKDWQIVDPKNLSKHTVMAFIGEHKKSFCPTINLAVEKVDISQKQYVKIVKKLHKKDPNTVYRELGNMKCAAGKGHLAELSIQSKGANLRMLQFILVKKDQAYVITAATLKDLFSQYQKQIQKAIQSFTITEDLASCIQDTKKKSYLQKAWNQLIQDDDREPNEKKKDFYKLQQYILKECSEMGSFWQVLTAKELHEEYEKSL